MMELPKRRATSLHGQPAPTEQCDLSQHLPVAPVGGSPGATPTRSAARCCRLGPAAPGSLTGSPARGGALTVTPASRTCVRTWPGQAQRAELAMRPATAMRRAAAAHASESAAAEQPCGRQLDGAMPRSMLACMLPVAREAAAAGHDTGSTEHERGGTSLFVFFFVSRSPFASLCRQRAACSVRRPAGRGCSRTSSYSRILKICWHIRRHH